MATSINADNGAVSGSAGLKSSADSSGVLALQTNGTTAVSISAAQVVSYTNQPVYSGGTANGVAYLNGSKVLTTGSALVFDGTNLGLGGTPSASALATIQSPYGITIGNNEAHTTKNAYYNGGWKYALAASTTAARFSVGESTSAFAWHQAVAGTAGNAITFTQAMTLNASGNLLVGTTTSTSRLVVATQAAGTNTITLVGGLASNSTGDSAINFQGYNSSGGFGATGTILVTQDASGNTSAGRMTFSTSAAGGVGEAERMRIDSSGNLGVGTTSPSSRLSVAGNITLTTASPTISTALNDYLDIKATNAGGAVRIYSGNSLAIECNSAQVITLPNLAGAGTRAVNANASGTLSAASDSRLKQEVEGQTLPSLAEVMKLEVKAYKWLDDINVRGADAAVEIGFFADQVAPIIPSAAPMGRDGYYGFYDRSVIAALVNAVKEQQALITQLQADVAALKGA